MRDINEIMAADRANTKRLRAELEARQMAEKWDDKEGAYTHDAPENPGRDENGLYPSDRPRATDAPGYAEFAQRIRDEQDAGLDTPRARPGEFDGENELLDTVRRIEEYTSREVEVTIPEIAGPDPYDFVLSLKASRDSWEFVTDDLNSAYLAGPMHGYKAFNHPLFNAVAKYLRHCGLVIENPAESDAEVHERAVASKHPLSVYMERDLADVARTDAVLVLPGWEQSEGAIIEVTVAWMLGHPVYALPSFTKVEPFFQETDAPMSRRKGFDYNARVGAPAPTPLPTDATARKGIPIATGVLDYFPAALAEVAKVSKAGNDQHNSGEALHWARGKSMDQADTLLRHLMERGTVDSDGMRHSAKVAWRALALLQIELEEAGEAPLARAAS